MCSFIRLDQRLTIRTLFHRFFDFLCASATVNIKVAIQAESKVIGNNILWIPDWVS